MLAWFIDLWRQSVQVSGGSSRLPYAGIAIDSGGAADDLIGFARGAFSQWTGLLASQLQAAGVPAPGRGDRHHQLGRDGRRADLVPGGAQQRAAGDYRHELMKLLPSGP